MCKLVRNRARNCASVNAPLGYCISFLSLFTIEKPKVNIDIDKIAQRLTPMLFTRPISERDFAVS